MPSPYVKKGYGEVSKRAEDRIRKDVIVKCKVCHTIMEFSFVFASQDKEGCYHCPVCPRNVIITQL